DDIEQVLALSFLRGEMNQDIVGEENYQDDSKRNKETPFHLEINVDKLGGLSAEQQDKCGQNSPPDARPPGRSEEAEARRRSIEAATEIVAGIFQQAE